MTTGKTTITAALAALLLAGTASAALAQEYGGHRGEHRGGGQDSGDQSGAAQNGAAQNRGGGERGERPQFRDNERRGTTGGEDRGGRGRSQFQSDQAAPTPPVAREAPSAPVVVQAPPPRPRAQFRGDGGQGLANGDRAARPGGERPREGDRRWDGNRTGGDAYRDANRDGRPDGDRRWDGNRTGGDANRDGRRDGDRRWDGNRNDGDRRDWDRNRSGDRTWDRNRGDYHGQPRWERGRYPPVYRSQQRYRYGYYRPPIGYYSHSWGFGEYLPRGWYGQDYLLDSWWDYGLPYPPPGYDWVRVGDDALLVDRFTGQVVQVVRDVFW